jgi:hypothetical protein
MNCSSFRAVGASLRAATLLLALLSVASCGNGPAAENHAKARAVLEQAGEGAPFADASDGARAAIRHVPSSMVCVLPNEGPFDMAAFPPEAANQGAYCSTVIGAVATANVVVKFSAPTNLDRAFAEALAESAARASPRAWPGEPSAADKSSPQGLPHFRIGRFEATIDGAPHYLRVAMSEAGGWYLQQIVTAPLAEAEAAEANAGLAWRVLLAEFKPPAESTQ